MAVINVVFILVRPIPPDTSAFFWRIVIPSSNALEASLLRQGRGATHQPGELHALTPSPKGERNQPPKTEIFVNELNVHGVVDSESPEW